MSTSLRLTRVFSTSAPSGDLRSSVMSRLLRLMTRYAADSPPLWGESAAYLVIKDRKSTRLNSSHQIISYAVFCLKKKKEQIDYTTITISILRTKSIYYY